MRVSGSEQGGAGPRPGSGLREASSVLDTVADTVQDAESRLLATERLAAIGEITPALAHESRNALQRVHACLALLRLRSGADAHALIRDMEDALGQLQRLYEEFRDFAAPLQLKLCKV